MSKRSSYSRIRVIALLAGIASGVSLCGSLHAQTSETLLSILQQQGVLTAEQVEAVKREAINAEAKKASPAVAAPVVAAPASAPLGLRLNGELRLRYEGFFSDNDAYVDRNRFRYRLRLGGTADVAKNVEVGLRLTTGVLEGEPTGNNATMDNNASERTFALDLAYAKWTPLKNADSSFAIIGGKMNTPFTSSDLVFDGDYTPEGLAVQYSRNVTAGQTVRVNAAQFILDELAATSNDPLFSGVQLRLDSAWSKSWSSTAGITYVAVSDAANLTNANVPDVHKGNTRTAGGVLVHNYHPFVIDAGVTKTLQAFPGYPGAFPIRAAADYMSSSGAETANDAYYAGVFFGKAAKRGSWEFNYRYRVIEADAWYEELADSDSGGFYQTAPAGGAIGYGGGTNVRGHILAGNYAVTDFALVGFTYFDTRLINTSPAGSDSAMRRIQVNTTLKF